MVLGWFSINNKFADDGHKKPATSGSLHYPHSFRNTTNQGALMTSPLSLVGFDAMP